MSTTLFESTLPPCVDELVVGVANVRARAISLYAYLLNRLHDGGVGDGNSNVNGAGAGAGAGPDGDDYDHDGDCDHDDDILGIAFRTARTWAQTRPVDLQALGFSTPSIMAGMPQRVSSRVFPHGTAITVPNAFADAPPHAHPSSFGLVGSAAARAAAVDRSASSPFGAGGVQTTPVRAGSEIVRNMPRKMIHAQMPLLPVLFVDAHLGSLCCGNLPRQSAALPLGSKQQTVSILPTYAREPVDVPVEDVVSVVCWGLPNAPASTYRTRLRFDDMKDTLPERRYLDFVTDGLVAGILAARLPDKEPDDSSSFLQRLTEDLSDTWLERTLREERRSESPAVSLPPDVQLPSVHILDGTTTLDVCFDGRTERIHRDFFVTSECEDAELGAKQLCGKRAAIVVVTQKKETIKYAHRLAARGWCVMCPSSVAGACLRQNVFDLKWSQDATVIHELAESMQQALNMATTNTSVVTEELAWRTQTFRTDAMLNRVACEHEAATGSARTGTAAQAGAEAGAEAGADGGGAEEDQAHGKHVSRLFALRMALVNGRSEANIPTTCSSILASDLAGSSRYFYESLEKQRSRYTWANFAGHVFVRTMAEISVARDLPVLLPAVVDDARTQLRDVFEPLRSYLGLCAEIMGSNAKGGSVLTCPDLSVTRVQNILKYNTSNRMTASQAMDLMNIVYWLEVHADPETQPIRDTAGHPAASTILRATASQLLRYGQIVQSTRRYEFHNGNHETRRIIKSVKEGERVIEVDGVGRGAGDEGGGGGDGEGADKTGCNEDDERRKLRAKFVETVGYGPDIKILARQLKRINHHARQTKAPRLSRPHADVNAKAVGRKRS